MRCRTESLLGLIGSLVLAGALPAIYVRSELSEVPLERLLANARERVEEAPDDTFALHTLARIHAMAYAWQLGEQDTVEANARDDGALVPSFGYEPPWVPWTRERRSSAQAPNNGGGAHAGEAEAREHLEAAIRLYRRALDSDPENTTIRLGLGWTLRESGETDEARELLREVIDVAAPSELEQGGHLGPLLATEAIDYLIPLLDAEEDSREIAELRAQREKLEALPRAITPIAVSLRPGLEPLDLLDATRPVRFDLDGSGRALPWPWLGPDAAWLAWDRHSDGAVGSALQLFGSRSFGLFFDDGYQALELLDDDRDGTLRGDELAGLALWRDRDHDGVSDPGEVVGLRALGVVAVGCRATDRSQGMLGARGSLELRDGRRLDSWDLVVESAIAPASKTPPESSASGPTRGSARTTPRP